MKNALRWLTVFAVVLLALGCAAALAETSGTCGDDLTWVLDDAGTLTISGTGCMYDCRYDSLPWGTNIEKAVLEEGVTSIGDYAFYKCNSLRSVTIPDSVTSIGNLAFGGCNNLKDMHIASIETWLSVSFADSYSYPNSYATNWYINGDPITSITIPNGMTSIGKYAFKGCSSLRSITIPASVTNIGNLAFLGCSNLKEMHIESIESWLRVSFADSHSRPNRYATDWYINGEPITSITIPDGVTSIGEYEFAGCGSLSNIIIPNGVTYIGDSAFYNCNSLTDITIPDGVTNIGSYAFSGCNNLTNITIPNSLTSIGSYAFMGCNNLSNLTIPDSITNIGNNAFYNCSAIIYTSFSSEAAKALGKANYAFKVKDQNYFLRYIYTDNSITGLEISKADKDATRIVIPDGVTSIGDSAFFDCWSLTSITIPGSVSSISDHAFYNCSHLTSITIPKSVTKIGNYAFFNCSRLTSITIPDGVTSIGNCTFYNCSSLKNIIIPDSMLSIGDSAFNHCSSLRSITIPDSVTSISHFAFYDCSSLTSITIPDGVTSIGSYTFYNCNSLTSVTIPASVTNINNSAFEDCSSLTSITIPDGVLHIGSLAFEGCDGLTSITIPVSVTSIGERALSISGLSEFKICFLGETTQFNDGEYGVFAWSTPTFYCYEFSDADSYATEKGYSIVYLDTLDIDSVRTISMPADFRMMKGDSKKLGVSVFPAHDHPKITWKSSAPNVAKVVDGSVTAISAGNTTITASVGSVSASMQINVYVEADAYELNHAETWLIAKESLQLTPVEIAPPGADVILTWASSDTSLAEVDANGLVTTKKPGDVTITATSETGIARSCLIHLCYPVTAVSLDPEISLKAGQAFHLNAAVTARTQSFINKLVTFASSNPSVVTVDADGLVTARAVGTATLTATAANGISASCTVTVREAYTLYLPSGLQTIANEAFQGDSSLEAVIVPDGCRSIGSKAFADCPNLIYIRIPASVETVAADAFAGSPNVRVDRQE